MAGPVFQADLDPTAIVSQFATANRRATIRHPSHTLLELISQQAAPTQTKDTPW